MTMNQAVAAVVAGTVSTVAVLALLGVARYLFQQGMGRTDVSDATRQRLVGCGFMLLVLGVIGLLALFGVGLTWLARLARLA
jgi:hypothetical protein